MCFLGSGTYSIGSRPRFHADSRGRYAKPWHMCREIIFSVFGTETLNPKPVFDILLLSSRPGNHLSTFLTSFTSSGMKSQPKWTNIHSIHAQNVFSWGRTRHRKTCFFLDKPGNVFSWGRTHFQKSNFIKVPRVLGQVHSLQGHFFTKKGQIS